MLNEHPEHITLGFPLYMKYCFEVSLVQKINALQSIRVNHSPFCVICISLNPVVACNVVECWNNKQYGVYFLAIIFFAISRG